MKKVSTAAGKATKNFRDHKLTIGLDLSDRSSWYCVLDEAGKVLPEQRLSTTPKAMTEVSGACRVAGSERGCTRPSEPVVELIAVSKQNNFGFG
jgi:hypothetical protein